MARASFALTTLIAAPPERVKNLIATIPDLGKYHPMIIGVKEIAADTSATGQPRSRYRVTDRMRVGPFRTRFTYLATVIDASTTQLVTEAFQSPGVHLSMIYDFLAEGDQTRVEERCQIDAPRLLRGTVLRQAKAAHTTMMAEIKRYLESE